MSQSKRIVLDTNLLLHFKHPAHIDWSVLGSGKHELIVLPIVLRELDKQKVHAPLAKIRDRASKTLGWLSTLIDAGMTSELENNLTLRFALNEPQIDFSENGLARDLQDDWIIASALEMRTDGGEPFVLATADIGLKLKARSRGIDIITPADSERLAEELDAQAKELNELRKENQQLKSRMPRLMLVFGESDRPTGQLDRPRGRLTIETPAQIRELHPLRRQGAQRSMEGMNYLLQVGLGLTEKSIERYNEALQEFYSKYDAFYEKSVAFLSGWEARVRVDLALKNIGTAPATQVDVMVDFPSELRLLDKDELPSVPKKPKAPELPKLGDALWAGLDHGDRMPLNYLPSIDFRRDRTYSQRSDKSTLHLTLQHLKQTTLHKLEPFWIQASSADDLRNLTLPVTISANELPGQIKQELNIVFNDA